MIIEAYALTQKRTEYGKAIRKRYESHEIYERRRNMTELQPRLNGICGTVTTILKDNYIIINDEQ
jgi:hypothetical protein